MAPMSLQSTAPAGIKALVSLCYCAPVGYTAPVSLLHKAPAGLMPPVSLILNISNPDMRLGNCPKASSAPAPSPRRLEEPMAVLSPVAETFVDENCAGDGRHCGACCSWM